MNARIERYGIRYWAVYVDGELLCVTLYKRGARAVIQFLEGRPWNAN